MPRIIAYQYDADRWCRSCSLDTLVAIARAEGDEEFGDEEATALLDSGDARGLEGDAMFAMFSWDQWCDDFDNPDLYGEEHYLECANCMRELASCQHEPDPDLCGCGDGCQAGDCGSCDDDDGDDPEEYSGGGHCSCDDCNASRDYRPEDEDVLASPEVLAKLPPLVAGIVFTPMTVEPPLSPFDCMMQRLAPTPPTGAVRAWLTSADNAGWPS